MCVVEAHRNLKRAACKKNSRGAVDRVALQDPVQGERPHQPIQALHLFQSTSEQQLRLGLVGIHAPLAWTIDRKKQDGIAPTRILEWIKQSTCR